MTDLLSSPFNFVQGDPIKVRVTAANQLGSGVESFISQAVFATVETVPHAPPTTVYVDQINTNSNQIALKWDTVSGIQNGGSTITLYNVQWDQGTDNLAYTLISTSALTYTATNSDGLLSGYPYKFRYRAQNKYGWGDYSEISIFNAASIPSQSDPAETKIENSFAKIEWDYPEDGSASIIEYDIQIKQKDGNYKSETYYCNGA